MQTMINQFRSARRASTPIIAIRTPDPAATMNAIKAVYEKNAPPIAQWDIIRGITAINEEAVEAVAALNGDDGQPASIVTGNPATALEKALELPDKTILFFHQAQLYVQGQDDSRKPIIQGIWNCRDQFKANKRTLVLLVPQIKLPGELANDVLVLDEPLPTESELMEIIREQFESAGLKLPSAAVLAKCVDAVSGLAAFPAEQVVAMSLDPKAKDCIDVEQLWERKRQVIEQADGLRVYRGGTTFDDLAGSENLKDFFRKIIKGKKRPKVFVFIDEIEKSMGNSAGNVSDTTADDQVKVLLTDMQDEDWTGTILYGFPGTGKSEFAKACGNEAECITVVADLGAMKGQFVGLSEERMRAFTKTIKAMGGKDVFFIATCNGVEKLRPELKRRFRKGIFFCDLPDKTERDGIWKLYLKKFSIKSGDTRPNDEGWTGAEIRACCENASEFGCSLKEAAAFLTITSKAMGKQVDAMRNDASGKYVNAASPGIYVYANAKSATAAVGGRREL